MKDLHDPHALLLQVVAHDLLAPLTAIKWQCELLERPGLTDSKRREYAKNIHHSAELGIAISKQAHTVARVLSLEYTGTTKQCFLHTVLQDSFAGLSEQYARHGLKLLTSLEQEQKERVLDVELVTLYAWLLAKYFLTITPAGNTVHVVGKVQERYGSPLYELSVSVTGIATLDHYVETFAKAPQQGTLDQTRAFAFLIQHVAPLLSSEVSALAEKKTLSIVTIFAAQ